MDKNYTIVETSKLAAVHGGGHIYSLISEDDVQNGHIGYVGDLAENVKGQETYEFGVFDADTINAKRAVLVANPEWDYDESKRTNQALYNYINKADEPFRAYSLIEGDVFAISAGGFDATGVSAITKGQYAILAADKTTLKIVATEAETAGYGFVVKIGDSVKRGIGYTNVGGQTYGRPSTMYWVRVERNDLIDAIPEVDVDDVADSVVEKIVADDEAIAAIAGAVAESADPNHE